MEANFTFRPAGRYSRNIQRSVTADDTSLVALPACILGLLERYHITRTDLGLDSVVLLCAQYNYANASPKDKMPALSREILYPAIEQVIHGHAALTAYVAVGPSSEPTFARVRSIDLSRIVRFLPTGIASPRDLETLMEQEFSNTVNSEGHLPLWRITVTTDNYVIFAWHHAIGDGLSGLAFHQALLQALNKPNVDFEKQSPDQDRSECIITITSSPPLVPALENLTDIRVSRSTLFRLLTLSLLPYVPFRSDTHVWTGNTVPTEPSLVNIVRTISIPSEQASLLRKVCRWNGTTITGFLHELTVNIIFKILQTDSTRAARKCAPSIPTTVPISLRRFTQTPHSAMSDQSSSYQHVVTYSPSDGDRSNSPLPDGFSWSRAAKLSRTLRETAPKSRELIGSLTYLFGRYESFFNSKLGKKRECGLALSNLGALKTDRADDGDAAQWNISKIFFAQNDGVQGAAIKVNVVGDYLGGINFTLTTGKDVLPHGFMDEFVREMKSYLLRASYPQLAKAQSQDEQL